MILNSLALHCRQTVTDDDGVNFGALIALNRRIERMTFFLAISRDRSVARLRATHRYMTEAHPAHITMFSSYPDFEAIHPHATGDAVYLFHDVLDWKLADGVERAATALDQPWFALHGTSTGMGILFDPERRPDVARAISPFRGSEADEQLLAQLPNTRDISTDFDFASSGQPKGACAGCGSSWTLSPPD